MGLGFTWEGWDGEETAGWSYSGFFDFRRRLARQIGVNLDDMDGYGGEKSWEYVVDPIKTLLDHSDCEGEISPVDCPLLAVRLRMMVKDWPEEWPFDYDKENALLLAKHMDTCAIRNVPLIFC